MITADSRCCMAETNNESAISTHMSLPSWTSLPLSHPTPLGYSATYIYIYTLSQDLPDHTVNISAKTRTGT